MKTVILKWGVDIEFGRVFRVWRLSRGKQCIKSFMTKQAALSYARSEGIKIDESWPAPKQRRLSV